MITSVSAIGASAADSEKNFTTNNNYQYNANFDYNESYGKSYKANYNGTDKVPSFNATYALKATKTTSIAKLVNPSSSEKLLFQLHIGVYDRVTGTYTTQRSTGEKEIVNDTLAITYKRDCTNKNYKYKLAAWIEYTNDPEPLTSRYLQVTAKQYR